MICSLAAYSG